MWFWIMWVLGRLPLIGRRLREWDLRRRIRPLE